eukprot:5848194-Lingulodinium_polyedra.AAC.1
MDLLCLNLGLNKRHLQQSRCALVKSGASQMHLGQIGHACCNALLFPGMGAWTEPFPNTGRGRIQWQFQWRKTGPTQGAEREGQSICACK